MIEYDLPLYETPIPEGYSQSINRHLLFKSTNNNKDVVYMCKICGYKFSDDISDINFEKHLKTHPEIRQ
jgi:hypothetical protein